MPAAPPPLPGAAAVAAAAGDAAEAEGGLCEAGIGPSLRGMPWLGGAPRPWLCSRLLVPVGAVGAVGVMGLPRWLGMPEFGFKPVPPLELAAAGVVVAHACGEGALSGCLGCMPLLLAAPVCGEGALSGCLGSMPLLLVATMGGARGTGAGEGANGCMLGVEGAAAAACAC